MILGPMRKQKKEKKFLTQLKKGERVVTKSGLHGKIVDNRYMINGQLDYMAGKIRYEISAISHEMSLKLNKKK